MVKTIVFYTGYSDAFESQQCYGSELCLHSLLDNLKKVEGYEFFVVSENCKREFKFDTNITVITPLTYKIIKNSRIIDYLIVFRYIMYFMEHDLTNVMKTYIWIHDTGFQNAYQGKPMGFGGRFLVRNMDDKIDGYISLTGWHKNTVVTTYGLEPKKVNIIGNGLNTKFLQKFNEVKESTDKNMRRFIWTSNPVRGLDLLLKIFIEKISKEFEGCELYIFRGVEEFNDGQLETITGASNVFYMEKADNEQLAVEFLKSDIWFYPTNFCETFCTSAIEAQLCGCIPICSNLAALTETVSSERGLTIDLEKYKYGSDEYIEQCMVHIRDVLNNPEKYTIMRKNNMEFVLENFTWESLTQKWKSLVFNDTKLPPHIHDYSLCRSCSSEVSLPKMMVINLDRRQDRWKTFKERASNSGIPENAYERFSATDGREMEFTEEHRQRYPLYPEGTKFYTSHWRRKGVIGCAESHYNLWKKLIDDPDHDEYLIVEDDIFFVDDFNEKWKSYYGKLRSDPTWRITYLGYNHPESYIKTGHDKFIDSGLIQFDTNLFRYDGAGFFSYCIRKEAAKFLVNKMDTVGCYREIDWFAVENFKYIGGPCYLIYPTIIKAIIFDNNINKDTDIANINERFS